LTAHRTIGNLYASSKAQFAEETGKSVPSLQRIETLLLEAVADLCTIQRADCLWEGYCKKTTVAGIGIPFDAQVVKAKTE